MFVLDCSVVLAWTMPDEESEYADQVLDLLIDQQAIVPSLWHLEIMNVLLMAEKRGRIVADKIPVVLETIGQLNIETDRKDIEISENNFFLFAQQHEITSYDATYLYLAQRENLLLATLDKKMKSIAKQLGCYLEQKNTKQL